MKGNHLVREARKRAGLSQADLAERVGTTQSAIARLERGVTAPSLQRISELVEACGFELAVSMGRRDDDHDWSLVQENLQLSPTQRLEKATAWARFARDLREAPRVRGSRA